MSGLIRRKLAEHIFETAEGRSIQKDTLERISWCVKCWRVNNLKKLRQKTFGINLQHLQACGIEHLGQNATDLTDFGNKVKKQVLDDPVFDEVEVTNNIFHTIVNENILKKEVLSSIIKEGPLYGLNGNVHRYKFNKSRKISEQPANENVVIEYSSPNIAKQFHAGHLRSTILGNFVANINAALGHRVTRLNYLGDWGTQFGLLAIGYKKYGSSQVFVDNAMENLYNLYVKINKDVADDSTGTNEDYKEAKEFFNKMESGDEAALEFWRKCRNISIEEYCKVYMRLGVTFDEYSGEALYNENCKILIKNLKALDLLEYDKETGVGFVDISTPGSGPKVWANVLKSDGSSLYLTRDIAAFLDRRNKYEFDRMHYVVENGQHMHFTHLVGVLKVMKQLEDDKKVSDFHIKFGRIDGMSTRKGNVVLLQDILDEAKSRMIEVMKNTKTTRVDNIEEVADILGVSAVIIQDLKEKRNKHYPFSWERILQFQGETGVYLQYTHARLANLEKGCGVPLDVNCNLSNLTELSALRLIQQLARYDEVIQLAYTEVEPFHIVQYLFEICKLVNAAHFELKVKDSAADIAEGRLLLFHCSRQVLGAGMKLLGLTPLNEM